MSHTGKIDNVLVLVSEKKYYIPLNKYYDSDQGTIIIIQVLQ